MRELTKSQREKAVAAMKSAMRGWKTSGVNRREFIEYSALAGLSVGSMGFASRAGGRGRSGHTDKHRPAANSEERTYLFNLSHLRTDHHKLTLIAGTARIRLREPNRGMLKKLRRRHPILDRVRDSDITHFVTTQFPIDQPQLCYVHRKERGRQYGYWDMAHMFYHLPSTALVNLQIRRAALLDEGVAVPDPVQWLHYGLDSSDLSDLDDPIGAAMLQDTTSQAVAMVSTSPEMISMEPNSAAYIQGQVGADSQTQVLGQAVQSQGAEWATQEPVINPDTGEQAVDSHGNLVFMPIWSDETNTFASNAIASTMPTVKNDTQLGTNITQVDPGDAESELLTGSNPLNGTVWSTFDGSANVDQSGGVQGSNDVKFTFREKSPDHGYRAEIESVASDGTSISFEVKNWYIRYLGLWVRYFDSDGQVIPVAKVRESLGDSAFEAAFPLADAWNESADDIFVDLVHPEFVILGIPVNSTTVKKTIPVPEGASGAFIVSSGLGGNGLSDTSDGDFDSTLMPGLAMTVLFNLSMPPLFMALAAAGGYLAMKTDLELAATALNMLPLVIVLIADEVEDVSFDDPGVWKNLGPKIGAMLFKQAAGPLKTYIAGFIAEGEAEEAIEDSVPILGPLISALFATATAITFGESMLEVGSSPRSYVSRVDLVHDIEVTILPSFDPPDVNLPAVATHYKVIAQFDEGTTPHVITNQLTTTSSKEVVRFQNVPFGGQVTVSVGFYSDDGWLAGKGAVGPVSNQSSAGVLSESITITEFLVPLQLDTQYSHKELIELDANGEHHWVARSTPPPASMQTLCGSSNGELCEATSITVSTRGGDVGYSFKSYNDAVASCETGAVSQLDQFANLSISDQPESNYFDSGCGFLGPVRMVYDLLGNPANNYYVDPTDNKNFVRQIRLDGSIRDFDGPFSDLAWGRLNFPSDALLLHPAGQLVSLNRASNKIEVLPLTRRVTDSMAPKARAHSGIGTRPGLLNRPVLAGIAPDGSLLVLEQGNNRIQAFDLNANPMPIFDGDSYFADLEDEAAEYLDFDVEYTGYMYVLSVVFSSAQPEFRMDIYEPGGAFLSRTRDFNAARFAVNYWRDVYALNFQPLVLPNGSVPSRTEPAISHWIPSTP